MEKEIIAKWKIKETALSGILMLLPELVKKTRAEKGNNYYAIYQSESNPGELLLHERYADAEAQEAHRNSDHYQSIVVDRIIPYLETREVHIVKRLF